MSTPYDLIGVVVADGHTMLDGTGAQVPSGGTAQVLLSQIPGLMASGSLAAPVHPADQSNGLDWMAWNLYTTVQSTVAAAAKLSARDSDFARLAQLLGGYSSDISKYALQLFTAINDGGDAQAQISLGPPVPAPRAGLVDDVIAGWVPDPAGNSMESMVDSRNKPVGLAAYRNGALDRLAWRLYTTARGAEGIATVLRPSDPVAAQLAQQLVNYSADISNYVVQLRTAINGETGGGT